MKTSFQQTIPRMFEDSVARYPANVLMWEKRGEKFEGKTYKEMHQAVHECAAGLMDLGIKPGDRLALISEGRNDWVTAELGMLYAGAINVPLSVKIEELTDLRFRIAHAGCRMAVVSGSQLHKLRQIKRDLPDLEKIIVFDGDFKLDEDEILFSEVLQGGKRFLQTRRSEFDSRWQSVKESDAANICYTSGTTADPKGIILTHRNYTANVEQASALLPIPEWYTSLLILPWDHCFAHTAGIYTLMKNGASMSSVQIGKTGLETLKNIPVNIKETRPAFLLSVPALAKNFRKNIEKGVKDKGPAIEKLFKKALDLAYAYNGNGWNRGEKATLATKLQYKLFDFLIFKKIRQNFGGRLKFFMGGGALLDIELQRFFYAIGVPMFQGYGLTESAPVISANVPIRHKLGSSGAIVRDLLVKICDEQGNQLPVGQQGEIVVKGENVMAGYWKNEKATNEALRDGWLYTGDLGYLDQDNFLYVVGRAKSLLISHDGEKYSPEGIEEAFVGNSRFIDQIMLYNNQSTYTVALIVPNKDNLLGYLKSRNLSTHTEEGQDAALRLLESEIGQYKKGGTYEGEFPERWLPAAVAVLGEGFTEQNHFLNSNMKMVRGKITEFYRDRIDYLFTPQGKDITNSQNRMIIKRLT